VSKPSPDVKPSGERVTAEPDSNRDFLSPVIPAVKLGLRQLRVDD
jgi:hypothetical protein